MERCVIKIYLVIAINLEKFTQCKLQRDVCPSGWHLPTREECDQLINYLGGSDQAFNKLIDGGSSGFNALLAGVCVLEPRHNKKVYRYDGFGEFAGFWTFDSDLYNKKKELAIFAFQKGEVGIEHFDTEDYNYGSEFYLYIRCIKN